MKYINIPIVKSRNSSTISIKSALDPKKQSTAKLPIGLKLAANTSAKLTEKAKSMHISRNALMTMAIERCLMEDVWRIVDNTIGDSTTVARNIAANPNPRLVELSNALLAMAFIADKLLIRNTKKQRDELGRICMDAKANLSVIRGSLGC
jgi:hypothetical protein